MNADFLKAGKIEFLLPDRKTVLVDTFEPVKENEILPIGTQVLTNQISDELPILVSIKSISNGYFKLNEFSGSIADYTFMKMIEQTTKYF